MLKTIIFAVCVIALAGCASRFDNMEYRLCMIESRAMITAERVDAVDAKIDKTNILVDKIDRRTKFNMVVGRKMK